MLTLEEKFKLIDDFEPEFDTIEINLRSFSKNNIKDILKIINDIPENGFTKEEQIIFFSYKYSFSKKFREENEEFIEELTDLSSVFDDIFINLSGIAKKDKNNISRSDIKVIELFQKLFPLYDDYGNQKDGFWFAEDIFERKNTYIPEKYETFNKIFSKSEKFPIFKFTFSTPYSIPRNWNQYLPEKKRKEYYSFIMKNNKTKISINFLKENGVLNEEFFKEARITPLNCFELFRKDLYPLLKDKIKTDDLIRLDEIKDLKFAVSENLVKYIADYIFKLKTCYKEWKMFLFRLVMEKLGIDEKEHPEYFLYAELKNQELEY